MTINRELENRRAFYSIIARKQMILNPYLRATIFITENYVPGRFARFHSPSQELGPQ